MDDPNPNDVKTMFQINLEYNRASGQYMKTKTVYFLYQLFPNQETYFLQKVI
jgi:hypothetical protein